jgi:hypothetical protein
MKTINSPVVTYNASTPQFKIVNYNAEAYFAVNKPDFFRSLARKFFPITFIGSILWIAAYSYLMVWWATIAGETIGIPPEVRHGKIAHKLVKVTFRLEPLTATVQRLNLTLSTYGMYKCTRSKSFDLRTNYKSGNDPTFICNNIIFASTYFLYILYGLLVYWWASPLEGPIVRSA